MKRHPRHVTLRRRWPQRYFSGLSQSMKLIRELELIRRRGTPYRKLKLGRSNKGGGGSAAGGRKASLARQKSKWTLLFHKTYPGLKFNKEAIARRTGISRSTLNTVYNRGLKAWKTGGSRPGATAPQWAVARVYKYVLVTKGKAPRAWYATRFDPDQNLRVKRV